MALTGNKGRVGKLRKMDILEFPIVREEWKSRRLKLVALIRSHHLLLNSRTQPSFLIWNPLTEMVAGSLEELFTVVYTAMFPQYYILSCFPSSSPKVLVVIYLGEYTPGKRNIQTFWSLKGTNTS